MKQIINRSSFFIFIAIATFTSFFYFGHLAIENSSKYRPLANGWVSAYASIQMDDSLNIFEKVEETIKADIVHGRFRPLFFFYTTASYALSPIIHGRITPEDKRKYIDLVTGDLQLYCFLLLISLAISGYLMSILICSYIDAKIFILIPLIFIPLSPSFTENLLQNYIDSQEIPLVLWITLWLFFLFKSFQDKTTKQIKKSAFFSISLIFFFIAFLTKETMIIVTLPLVLLTLLVFYTRYYDVSSSLTNNAKYVIITFISSLVCTVAIITVVSIHKHGYASAYQSSSLEEYKKAMEILWTCMSRFTLHNYYGFIPIGLSFLLLYIKKGSLINGRSVIDHFSLSITLLSLSYGFLFILTPWDPILIKYILPSVFFFSFSVAYSLGIIFHWLKSYKNIFLTCIAYGLFIPYIFLFIGFQKSSSIERDYLFRLANYGVSSLGDVVDNISNEIHSAPGAEYKVFVGFEAISTWKNHIAWSALHLKRMFNFNKELNILDSEGNVILNVKMPKDEITSYMHHPTGKNLFLSENRNDLDIHQFDIVYVGFPGEEIAPATLSFDQFQYKNVGEIFEYQKKYDIHGFRIYKYYPEVVQ